MKAAVLVRHGKAESAFQVKEQHDPMPSEEEVLIEVEAFGVNYTDILTRRGAQKYPVQLPQILGHEVVGKVIKVGSVENEHLLNVRVLAIILNGAYAQKVTAKIDYCWGVDAEDNAAELCGIGLQGITAWYISQFLVRLRSTDIVLVHAASTINPMLMNYIEKSKATSIALIHSEFHQKSIRYSGSDFVLSTKQKNYKKQINDITRHKGVQVVFNSIGGNALLHDFDLLGVGGRLVHYESTFQHPINQLIQKLKAQFITRPSLDNLLLKSKSFLSADILLLIENNKSIVQIGMKEVLKDYRLGIIHPFIEKTVSIDQLAQVHQRIELGQAIGKIVVEWK